MATLFLHEISTVAVKLSQAEAHKVFTE
jgi:hypothetical protein